MVAKSRSRISYLLRWRFTKTQCRVEIKLKRGAWNEGKMTRSRNGRLLGLLVRALMSVVWDGIGAGQLYLAWRSQQEHSSPPNDSKWAIYLSSPSPENRGALQPSMSPCSG